jgi:hypothetical protein|tara:strand:+ start:2172 stop:2429 length:258 start_codon:yes stop_codon:yes gene_type:complete
MEVLAMMMIQLNPAIPLNTPRGEGLAHVLIDYGPEHELYWTVFLSETGDVYTFSNGEVRASKNVKLGRLKPERPKTNGHAQNLIT